MSTSAMPPLIYGTAWKKDKTADLVIKAVKSGFRGIDTACQPKHYNEPGVGVALERLFDEGISRKDVYIQTKFTPVNGQDPLNMPYHSSSPLNEQIAKSFEVSKKNLGVEDVDGLLLHSPLENINQTMIAWTALEKIYNEKGAKLIGISNCYDVEMLKQLFEMASVKPAMIQNRFYQDTGYDIEIRKFCGEHQVIYQSFWTLTANPQILSSKAVQKAAQAYQKTAPQILFRVLVTLGIVPLIGTCSEAHMKEDLEILNFDLPQSVIEEISSTWV